MPNRNDIVSSSRRLSVPGVTFRGIRGPRDHSTIMDIVNRSWKADLFVGVNTVEDIARNLRYHQGFNYARDAYIVELLGRPVGYAEVVWADRLQGVRSYHHSASLVPEARGRGIRQAMLRLNEEHIRAKASRHKKECTRYFETEANSKSNNWNRLVLRSGYVPYRHVFEMMRPNLERVPMMALPTGLSVRAVGERDLKKVWNAAREAFKDEPGYRSQTWSDDGMKWFMGSRWWTPDMWRIAWNGDEVAGGVINFIDDEENRAFKRSWGYTAIVFTARDWRRRGLASALISQSLGVLKERGVRQAALAVDTENPSGALRLYKRLGFKKHSQYTFYRKPLE